MTLDVNLVFTSMRNWSNSLHLEIARSVPLMFTIGYISQSVLASTSAHLQSTRCDEVQALLFLEM